MIAIATAHLQQQDRSFQPEKVMVRAHKSCGTSGWTVSSSPAIPGTSDGSMSGDRERSLPRSGSRERKPLVIRNSRIGPACLDYERNFTVGPVRTTVSMVIHAWEQLGRVRLLTFSSRSAHAVPSGWDGQGVGRVEVKQPDDVTLIFRESGAWRNGDGPRLNSSDAPLDPGLLR